MNVAYAERFALRWVVLSAKYGFIDPNFIIPGPYDVSFNRPPSGPIEVDELHVQVVDSGLIGIPTVVGLGGRHYRDAITRAFVDTGAKMHFPFAGMPLGRMIQATRRAIECGDPGLAR